MDGVSGNELVDWVMKMVLDGVAVLAIALSVAYLIRRAFRSRSPNSTSSCCGGRCQSGAAETPRPRKE